MPPDAAVGDVGFPVHAGGPRTDDEWRELGEVAEDAKEGIAAFTEKRAPVWKGR